MGEALIVRKGGGKKSGAYVWKKLTAEGGDFVDFAVDNDPNKYPDGGEQGGYWYEKVIEFTPEMFGYSKISIDKFTFTSDIGSQEFINHSLGEIPKMAIIIGKDITGGLKYMFTRPEIEQQSQLNGYIFTLYGSNYSLATSSIKFNVNVSKLQSVDYAYGYQGGKEYTLITMA